MVSLMVRPCRRKQKGMMMVSAAIFILLLMAVLEGLGTLSLWGGPVTDYVNVNDSGMTDDIDDPSWLVGVTNPTAGTWDYYAAMAWAGVTMLASLITVLLRVVWHTFTIGFYLQTLMPFIPTWFCAIFTLIFWVLFAIDLYQLKTGTSIRDKL